MILHLFHRTDIIIHRIISCRMYGNITEIIFFGFFTLFDNIFIIIFYNNYIIGLRHPLV